jgi:hypothetical protein
MKGKMDEKDHADLLPNSTWEAKDGNLNFHDLEEVAEQSKLWALHPDPDHEGQAGSPLACGNPPRTGLWMRQHPAALFVASTLSISQLQILPTSGTRRDDHFGLLSRLS